MLGKQGWRFVTNPTSIVSRLHKARYFQRGSFFEAKLGNNPSFIWRSILEAKELIRTGVRWNVGSGNNIDILGQPWLDDKENPYITSRSQSLENTKVLALRALDHRGWDEDILKDLFNERDQECIRRVQLGDVDDQDIIYWSQESTGQYTVRSAYRMLQRQKNAWSQQDNTSFWNKVWRIKAPPKVLNMVWRSLANCLPTNVLLNQMSVPVDPLCPRCKESGETIAHALVHCSVIKQCWQLILPEVVCTGEDELSQWWERVLQVCNNDRRAEVATIIWAIWRARNDLIWNKKYTRTNVMIALAKQYLVQWRTAQKSRSDALSSNTLEGDEAVVWAKPQMETIKITVDGATFEEVQSSGIGLLARNHDGELVSARTRFISRLISAEEIEGIAVKEALSWVKHKQWKQVVIESDSLMVVQAIRSKVRMSSPFGRTIEECRKMMKELNTVSLFFIKRYANMAAHELARESYSFPDRCFDRNSIPIEVMNAVIVDAS